MRSERLPPPASRMPGRSDCWWLLHRVTDMSRYSVFSCFQLEIAHEKQWLKSMFVWEALGPNYFNKNMGGCFIHQIKVCGQWTCNVQIIHTTNMLVYVKIRHSICGNETNGEKTTKNPLEIYMLSCVGCAPTRCNNFLHADRCPRGNFTIFTCLFRVSFSILYI